jgi:2-keto-3-deoxy-L-rhamnonate aldolase RhmA
VICQLETAEAVQNADAIAAVDGVDVLFVGPNDLSANLGVFREFERAEFTRAVNRVLQAARRSGKAAGIMAGGPEDALTRLDQGFTFVSVTSDARLLGGAADAAFKKVREGLAERSRRSLPRA